MVVGTHGQNSNLAQKRSWTIDDILNNIMAILSVRLLWRARTRLEGDFPIQSSSTRPIQASCAPNMDVYGACAVSTMDK